ncbi:MAG: hypothetical protein P4L79_10645 [Legionella sp.]|uniref:hypothetical protein n=1 Tax=Legionella sp. TaxID=459 RepID=UPI002845B0D6|nr:hypothetical protein [Legionella sp.]
MSADNFVAVLQTEDGFRVIKAHAFENLLNKDGGYDNQKVYDAFNGQEFFLESIPAFIYANKLEESDRDHTEYGIFVVPFKQITFDKLKNETEYEFHVG